MKKFFNSNKFKHGTLATVFTALFIALLIILNVVVSMLSERFPSINIDLTPNKMNTLSEKALDTAVKAELETTIYLIGKESDYKDNIYFASYGLQYSQVANIAEKMQEANPSKIKVEYVDPDLNPKLITDYASEKLEEGKVLIVSEARYKTLDVLDFFSVQQDQSTYTTQSYSKVDGAFSNAVHLVNLDFVPVVAVATGHDEQLSTDARQTFDTLMNDNGFDIVEFNVLTEEIPEDARMIVIPTPSTDYSIDEIAKLEAFLDDTSSDKGIYVSSTSGQIETPILDSFLAQWGIKVGDGVVVESDPSKCLTTGPTFMLVNYTTEGMIPDARYNTLIAGSSSPIEFTFDTNDGITTLALLTTSDTAYVSLDNKTQENPETSSFVTSAVAYRKNSSESTRSYVMVSGDTAPLSYQFLGSTAFDNKDYIVESFKFMTNIDDVGTGLYIDSIETNIMDITATKSVIQIVGLYIFTIFVPLAILAIGLIIFLRRRHL